MDIKTDTSRDGHTDDASEKPRASHKRKKPMYTQRWFWFCCCAIIVCVAVAVVLGIALNQPKTQDSDAESTSSSIGASEDAGAKTELSEEERSVFLQTQINEWFLDGWSEVQCTDNSESIEFDFSRSDSGEPDWGETEEEQEEWKSRYLSSAQMIAQTIHADVTLNFYTSDAGLEYSVFASKSS